MSIECSCYAGLRDGNHAWNCDILAKLRARIAELEGALRRWETEHDKSVPLSEISAVLRKGKK